jgi:hypothetical protein
VAERCPVVFEAGLGDGRYARKDSGRIASLAKSPSAPMGLLVANLPPSERPLGTTCAAGNSTLR